MTTQTKEQQLPWTEKYRPFHISELMLSEPMKNKILQFVETQNMPNTILTGPPGVGKTSTIKCIAIALYGKHYYRSVLEINASDERGIKSVQGDIINFCRAKLCYTKEDKPKYPKFKLIIMDEADNMIERAQQQINMLMETFKDTVRFAFTSNTSSDIIEALQSKCLLLRYIKLPPTLLINRLAYICKRENVPFDDSALQHIAHISSGDMRNAINMLQLLHNKTGSILYKNIDDLCDMPQPYIIASLFNAIIKCDLRESLTITTSLKNNGYCGSDITLSMIHTIRSDLCDHIPEALKISLLDLICMSAYKISKGTDSALQIAGCVAVLIDYVEKNHQAK